MSRSCEAARGRICQTHVQGLPHIAHQQDGLPLQLTRDWDEWLPESWDAMTGWIGGRVFSAMLPRTSTAGQHGEGIASSGCDASRACRASRRSTTRNTQTVNEQTTRGRVAPLLAIPCKTSLRFPHICWFPTNCLSLAGQVIPSKRTEHRFDIIGGFIVSLECFPRCD